MHIPVFLGVMLRRPFLPETGPAHHTQHSVRWENNNTNKPCLLEMNVNGEPTTPAAFFTRPLLRCLKIPLTCLFLREYLSAGCSSFGGNKSSQPPHCRW